MNIIKDILDLEHESNVIERVGIIMSELLEYGIQLKVTKSSDILVSYNGKNFSIMELINAIESEDN